MYLVNSSINYITQKIKGLSTTHKEEILVSLIIIFVGSASYGAGVLSTRQGHSPIEIRQSATEVKASLKPDVSSIKSQGSVSAGAVVSGIIQSSTTEGSSNQNTVTQGTLIASRNGTAYYLPHCNSSRILDKNKIYFKTEADAEKAGYHLAGNCKR